MSGFKFSFKKSAINTGPKPELIKYNEPLLKDMAILLVYFNPCKYRKIIQNSLTVKHQLDCAKIPYFIGEIKHNSDSQYLFSSSDNVFQYSSNSYMFYKENLIRIVESKLSSEFTKICIMDFDIFFDNPDWYSIVSEKLNTVNVVQPFKHAYYLNNDYSINSSRTNCVDNKTLSPIKYRVEHSGFVWAFDRKWFSTYCFDDMIISGMGDTVLANNITKRVYDDRESSSIFYKNFSDPAKFLLTEVSYGSCDLNVYHLNHGPLVNRQYDNIHNSILTVFAQNNIKKIDDIMRRRDDGILEYKPAFLDIMNTVLINYFRKRNDDFAYFVE